ncbi:dihydrodipicolinate synthase family protein [Streptomyces sp. JNUCC 64]
MARPPLEGVIAYPVTPFDPRTGALDLAALDRLADELVTSGSHAVAPLGSTGESAYLREDEWDAVCETTLGAVAGRVPTLVGVSHWSTEGTVRRARFAARHGATAIMVLPQVYWKLTEDELRAHFAAVASATDLPVMLYNNPGTSGVDLRPRTVVALARDVPQITMVKESSGDVSRFRAIPELSDGALSVYNGNNPVALEAFRAGAAGWCTAAPCLLPRWCLDLRAAALDEDPARADALLAALLPFLRFIVDHGLPRAVKAGRELQGRAVGPPRAPLRALPGEATERLRELLRELGSHPLVTEDVPLPAAGPTTVPTAVPTAVTG